MSTGWSETIEYEKGLGSTPKPYLWLTIWDLHQTRTITIPGLVDTGADKSVLPKEYAEMLGYTQEELRSANVKQLQGSVSGWEAKRSCVAFFPEAEDTQFEMRPLFVEGPHVLWGRGDLMRTFEVCVSEKREELTLRLPP